MAENLSEARARFQKVFRDWIHSKNPRVPDEVIDAKTASFLDDLQDMAENLVGKGAA